MQVCWKRVPDGRCSNWKIPSAEVSSGARNQHVAAFGRLAIDINLVLWVGTGLTSYNAPAKESAAEALWFWVCRPAVRPSVNAFSRATIYMYIVQGFEWNLTQIFIIWVGIDVNFLRSKVRGRGHDHIECYNHNGMQMRAIWQCGIDVHFYFYGGTS